MTTTMDESPSGPTDPPPGPSADAGGPPPQSPFAPDQPPTVPPNQPPTVPPNQPPPVPPHQPPFGGSPGGYGAGGFPATTQRLRRSREDRVASGLAGGLGRYFGLDPVIFRVLFAVLALFGGSGIALYLLGWLAVPEEGATNAPVDRAIAELRRRRVPFWLVVGAGLLLGWALFFSWWAPHTLIPAVIVAVAVVVLLARRRSPVPPPAAGDYASPAPAPAPPPWSPPTSAAETQTVTFAAAPNPAFPGTATAVGFAPPPTAPDGTGSPYGTGTATGTPGAFGTGTTVVPPASSQLRTWFDDSRAAARVRRRRSAPLRLAVLAAVVVAVAVLAVVDAVSGIPFAAYFWTVGAIVLTGLVLGLLARRTPWSTGLLLIPVAVGLFTFASSPIQAHDGWGDRSARPATVSAVQKTYKLAFGRDTIDLSQVKTLAGSRTVKIVHGAGQVRLIVPSSLPVRIDADVHSGDISLNGQDQNGGVNFTRSFATPAAVNATDVLRISVQLAAGQLEITYV